MTDGYKVGYLRFTAWFLGLTIAIPAASVALQKLTGVELGQFAGSVIPMIIGAMQEGVQFARGTKRLPTRKERLLIARMLTAIAVAWSSVVLFVGYLLAPATGAMVVGVLGPAMVFGLILLMIAMFFFLGWLFLGMGAKNEIKLAQKLSLKDLK